MTEAAAKPAGGMKSFFILWTGQTVSLLGTHLTGFALGVWVYQQTGSVTRFALLSFLTVLPSVALAPIIGAVVDRHDRRKIMIAGDAGSALSILVLAALFWTGHLNSWGMYVALGISSICAAFQGPAYLAAAAQLAPKDQLSRVSGLMQLSEGTSQLIAPIVAGLLLAQIGLQGMLAFDCASFVIAVVTQLWVRLPRGASTDAARAEPFLRATATGWRFIRARPGLIVLLASVGFGNLVFGFLQTLLTPLVLSFTTPAGLGTVLSLSGLGLLAGSGIASAWRGPKRRADAFLLFTLIQGFVLLLAGFRPSVTLVTAAAFVYLFCDPLAFNANQVIWLSEVPTELQGRVLSIRRMVVRSCMPAAFLLGGPLADKLFEPMLRADGLLAGSVGLVLGVGDGRGIAFFLASLGALLIVANVLARTSRSFRALGNGADPVPEPLPAAAGAVSPLESP